jgi:hypothetical protein
MSFPAHVPAHARVSAPSFCARLPFCDEVRALCLD